MPERKPRECTPTTIAMPIDAEDDACGYSFSTQLVPVTSACAPLLVSLAGAAAQRSVVRVRPRLLHYVEDGKLMCVIKSAVAITGVDECGKPHSDASASAQQDVVNLLVATANGEIWIVTLPPSRLPAKLIVLKHTPSDNTRNANNKWTVGLLNHQVPGVQIVLYHQQLQAMVCTSLLTPTTVFSNALATSSSDSTTSSFELVDLEADQSTCLVVLDAQSGKRSQLVGQLIAAISSNDQALLTSASGLVIQGDLDGSMQIALVDMYQRSCIAHRELLRLQEPVQSIMPCRVSSSSENHDALLILGARGGFAIWCSSTGHALHSRFDEPILSATVVGQPVDALVYVSKGGTFALPLEDAVREMKKNVNPLPDCTLGQYAAQLPIPSGVIQVTCGASKTGGLSLLCRSGRLITYPPAYWRTLVQPLLRPLNTASDASDPSINEVRLKFLLNEINRISTQSAKFQTASNQTDALLRQVHSALQLLILVQDVGADSVIDCELWFDFVSSGWNAQSKCLRLHISVQLKSIPESIMASLSLWQFAVAVRTNEASVSSFSFPLTDCIAGKQTIQLDEHLLTQQTSGVVRVTCHMLFTPGLMPHPSTRCDSSGGKSVQMDKLFALSIPVVDKYECHLIQLSEPCPADAFPLNPTILRERFSHDHGSIVPCSSPPEGQGARWWPAALEYATECGVVFPPNDSVEALKTGDTSAPLRVVVRIACNVSTEVDTSGLKEETVLGLLQRLLNVTADESRLRQWRTACRIQSGKWWVGMTTYTGNLVVLKFASIASEIGEVELTIQTSNVADLAAMRALVVDIFQRDGGYESNHKELARAALALASTRHTLGDLESIVNDIEHKMQTALGSHDSVACVDEVLQLLLRLASAETRTLDLYWQSRDTLSRLAI